MKKIIFLMISILAITVPSISAEEAYPAGITFDGDTLIWENGGNAELQRLSADEPWTTIYNGSDGSYTDNDSDGMRYYRVKTDGEDEWKYSYAKFNSDSAYCIYGWDYYESNTSGNLEYSAGKTDAGTYKIEKTSAYASSDYAGICQNVESELLESGKSYTLSFDHKRVGVQLRTIRFTILSVAQELQYLRQKDRLLTGKQQQKHLHAAIRRISAFASIL